VYHPEIQHNLPYVENGGGCMDIRRFLDRFIDTTRLTDQQLMKIWQESIKLSSPFKSLSKKEGIT
jgi:hypothetical protein